MYIKDIVVKNAQVIYEDGVIIMALIENCINHHFEYSWNAMTFVRDWLATNVMPFLGHHLAFALKTLT